MRTDTNILSPSRFSSLHILLHVIRNANVLRHNDIHAEHLQVYIA